MWWIKVGGHSVISSFYILGQTSVRTVDQVSTPEYLISEPMPNLRVEYRVFSRARRVIFGDRALPRGKFCPSSNLVSPNTSLLLGEGAPPAYHQAIAGALSSSVAAKTKTSYSTAIRMLHRCQADLGRIMTMPLTDQDILCFVAYMQTRKVAEKTISGYLAGLRLATISLGYPCVTLLSPTVKQILKGIKNSRADPRISAQKKTRRAVTVPHLELLGHSIGTSGLSHYMKSLVWAVSLSSFWGAFRVGELLNSTTEVELKSSCLLSDLEIDSKTFKIWVRSPKVASPNGDVVEVYGVPSSALDPVAAMHNYIACRRGRHGSGLEEALFLAEDGKPFTRKRFNSLLHELLDPFVTDDRDSLTGHSFRSGLATLMQAAGMSAEAIKAWGRWSSSAYLLYCKEGRSKAEVWAKLHHVLSLPV